MTQYNTLNVKLSNSQLHKFKSAIKDRTKVTLSLSSNVVGDSNDENNCTCKLLLTNTQVSKIRKAFANGLSANIKLSKTELQKILKSGEFLGGILGQLLKVGVHLIGNVFKPLAKSVLISIVVSGTDAAIHKKILRSTFTILLISNEEMNDFMKIVKFPEGSGLLIKNV